MNHLRSSLARNVTSRMGARSSLMFASGSVLGASRVNGMRASIMHQRGYASEGSSKKGGSGGLLFLSLVAVGGVAGYYYNSTQSFQTKTATTESKPKEVDYQQIYNEIADMLEEDPDYDDGSYAPVLVRLGWHASGTYDKESKTGGSDGATMRFDPEAGHGANNGLHVARALMDKIHKKHPEISVADLWIIAAIAGIQETGGPIIPFRPGRTDAVHAQSIPPTPADRLPDATKKEDHIRDIFYRMGFNDQEIVALAGAHALGRCHPDRSGFDGPWQEAPTMFSNEYYKVISGRKWIKKNLANGGWQWVDKNNTDVMMLPAEISMYNDKEFKKYFDLYAKDQDKFYDDFAKAFTKLLELGVPFTGEEKVYKFKPTTE